VTTLARITYGSVEIEGHGQAPKVEEVKNALDQLGAIGVPDNAIVQQVHISYSGNDMWRMMINWRILAGSVQELHTS
jgi:hypothetical protein